MLEASFNSTRDAEMPLASAAQRTPLTCWSEVAAYLIVQVLRIAVVFALSLSGILTPVFSAAYRWGGQVAFVTSGFVISLVWFALAFPLFLVARGFCGGTPAMIAEPGKRHAITSAGFEIGTYFVVNLLGVAASYTLKSCYSCSCIQLPRSKRSCDVSDGD